MRLGSFFDGIGGWLLAAEHAGITPVWSSEIEPFPRAVTAYHFPDVMQLGDITKLNGSEIPPADIVCSGSPCQDLSMAGKRRGLKGGQSGLFYTAIKLVRRMQKATDGEYPRFFIWENVPGVFSSNKGNDFRAVLEEIGKAKIPMPDHGKWAGAGVAELPLCEIAWRTLDAQYFGVAQHRRRIFLVADFAERGRCASEILFEPQDVRKPVKACQDTGESITGKIRTSFAGTDARPDVKAYDPSHRSDVIRVLHSGKVNTLSAYMGTGGNNIPLVLITNKVRKLTPTECERLQGLPDGYTNVSIHGKLPADAQRYKAIGNGMAQPCADYILRRIREVLQGWID